VFVLLVGVISDTHDNIPALKEIISRLKRRDIDIIVHLGDYVSPFTVRIMHEELGNHKVIGVLGNNDGDILLISRLFNKYGWELHDGPSIIDLDGVKFLIMHGYDGIEHTERIASLLVGYEGVSGVLYGHTHKAVYLRTSDGRIILNPGEACGYLTGRSSFALLDTNSLEAKIIYL
jgi:putative phosphoesterase